ncbi:MAG TPA: 5-(carboxyamino)imidazole ribonucleotide synthase [Steroidobacteraceae bacterium]|nr:5-(carboxyamino)imidazole ribonucleotide synthase [Steroidobacteraceae bacterium]
MTIGVVGAGQLGRMLALAGYPLGFDFLFLDRDRDTPAARLAPILTGAFTDSALLDELAARSEVVTFDWENVSVEALARIERGTRIAPPLAALQTAQDRLLEKQLFAQLRIPTNRNIPVESLPELTAAVQSLGLPGVLKARRLGYDGKGQVVLRTAADIETAWAQLQGGALLYEEFVPFDYEVSIIGVRSSTGETAIYPLNRNLHRDGILRMTRAPWHAPSVEAAARRHLRRLLAHFDYVGVLTVEFFVRRGKLCANEMAPRVHNSGHWTIEGAVTSQFENHLRAILGLPLGETTALGHCAMVNLIGEMPEKASLLADKSLFLHDYGKVARPGRKLGHCTVMESTARRRDLRAASLLKRVDSRKIRG